MTKEKISQSLREKIDKMQEGEKMGVLAGVYKCLRHVGLEKRTVTSEIREATTPLIEYLKEKGTPAIQDLSVLGMVYVELEKRQIYDLIKQEFVDYIIENQKVNLIR